MRRPSQRLIIAFLISLAIGYIVSWLVMVDMLKTELRLYGFTNLSVVAILVAFLVVTFLDTPLNLGTFDWPEPTERDAPYYAKLIGGWLTSVDHKKIGLMYIIASLVFFIIGGIQVGLMRLQLAVPNGTILNSDTYNQLLAMHITTMVFLVILPLIVGLSNYVIVLMIGAKSMAYRRLTSQSFWLLILGGILLLISSASGGAPNGSWLAQAPVTPQPFAPILGIDWWALGLLLVEVSLIASAFNFIVTILYMRAPGMSLYRMPIFAWSLLIQSFLTFAVFTSFAIATILLLSDHAGITTFYFTAEEGANPLLWQNLFRLFGHPEVYLLILPAMGIVTEVIPSFSRRHTVGYLTIVYSTVVIGLLGLSSWAHYTFQSIPGETAEQLPATDMLFTIIGGLVIIPVALEIFGWIATMWSSSIRLKAPIYFAAGFVITLIIGSLSGVALTTISPEAQDTYLSVGYIHNLLLGGSLFGIFAGLYYWFPKMTGRLLNDARGKFQFWVMFVGFFLAILPMQFAGAAGMSRQIATYAPGSGWELFNSLSTIGAFFLILSLLIFLANVFASLRNGRVAGDDPWDAWTLEWATTSPPPEQNFESLPQINSQHPLWDLKHS